MANGLSAWFAIFPVAAGMLVAASSTCALIHVKS